MLQIAKRRDLILPPPNSEAVARRCSAKKVFLEISQNSEGNTCARVSFLINLQASKNTFSYRTPPVAASANCHIVNEYLNP